MRDFAQQISENAPDRKRSAPMLGTPDAPLTTDALEASQMADSQSTRKKRPSRWQPFDLVRDAARVPRRGGVYAIYDFAGDLIYIGSSGNVRTRVIEHRRKATWRVWMAKISFMKGNWYRREQRLIRRLLPPCNRRLTYHHFYLTK